MLFDQFKQLAGLVNPGLENKRKELPLKEAL